MALVEVLVVEAAALSCPTEGPGDRLPPLLGRLEGERLAEVERWFGPEGHLPVRYAGVEGGP